MEGGSLYPADLIGTFEPDYTGSATSFNMLRLGEADSIENGTSLKRTFLQLIPFSDLAGDEE